MGKTPHHAALHLCGTPRLHVAAPRSTKRPRQRRPAAAGGRRCGGGRDQQRPWPRKGFFFWLRRELVVVEGLRSCEVFLGQGVANGKDRKVKRAGLML